MNEDVISPVSTEPDFPTPEEQDGPVTMEPIYSVPTEPVGPAWVDSARNSSARGGTSIPVPLMDSIQSGILHFSYRGHSVYKSPFDWTLYPMLLWEQRPRTLIEIGSHQGSSAQWLSDTMESYGLPLHVHSIDLNRVNRNLPRVTFHQGDAENLGDRLTQDFMRSLPRPLLVIEDASHHRKTSLAVLDFFHPWLRSGEYIVVEAGIMTDMAGPDANHGGPRRAIEDFLAAHPGEYDVDSRFCDFFGANVTWNVNGFLRKR